MIKNKRKKEFIQDDLRKSLLESIKKTNLQPYQFAQKNGISVSTIYRLISRMNVSKLNEYRIKSIIDL